MPALPFALPIDELRVISPESAQAFRSLRDAVSAAGPLDQTTCELILIGSFVAQGHEIPLKTFASRLRQRGVALEALRQAVLVTFAASATLIQVTTALRWLDEVEAFLAAESADGGDVAPSQQAAP